MKATGSVHRINDLLRVVIPKEMRRTMRIKEGEASFPTLTDFDKFYIALHSVAKRTKAELITKFLQFFILYYIQYSIYFEQIS